MPSFDIVKSVKGSDSFRSKKILGQFELESNKIQERFQGDIPIEGKPWNVGVIVGPSGSGKSTITNELFPGALQPFTYTGKSIVDDMPESVGVDDITRAFTSVGFSSVPSWLKPYDVLSNGEKMRVDLARAILSNDDPIVFDEFTSVVDRQVAMVGSICIQKTIRKQERRFIAVTCHYDVIDWLEPDWVFDTNEMSFSFTKGANALKGGQSPSKSVAVQEANGTNLAVFTI